MFLIINAAEYYGQQYQMLPTNKKATKEHNDSYLKHPLNKKKTFGMAVCQSHTTVFWFELQLNIISYEMDCCLPVDNSFKDLQ